MDLRALLSPEQYEAATWTDGPVCILAGAGSGKTRVVTHRIAYLIGHKRARPWSILAVTFTNKAAGEMRHRVEQLVPGVGKQVKVGTFHGMAARFLRQYGDAVGVNKAFVIYDSDDQKRLMKRVVADELNWSKELVRPFLSRIGGWQSEGLTPGEVPPTSYDRIYEQCREAYALYWSKLEEMGAVDFGGLLLKLRDLLRSPAGAEITDRIAHLLVDEYQDVNRVQTEIVHAVARHADTIAVVGDDDQAIYGWRGASADNLKHFVDQVDNAHLVRLEDNYRSTANILLCANEVIANNVERLGKELRPKAGDGRRIRVLRARDDIEESRRVVSMIQDDLRAGRSPEDIAVLYRTNASSRLFEDELRKAHIAYRLVGGVRFYDRKEVKDVLAVLRSALNPRSDVDTMRMVGAVPRGIGAKSLEKMQAAAAREGLPLLEVMRQGALLDGIGVAKKARKASLELAESVSDLGEQIRPRTDPAGNVTPARVDARQAVALATEISGVADRLEAEGTAEAEGRLENLGALLSAATQFVEEATAAGTPTDILGFLEDAALLGGDDVDPSADDDGERITLMTLHSAKGLEFPTVFLVGLEEGLFPHAMATGDNGGPAEVEEERRLAYVGITRAKQRLVLTWARRRMVQGTPRPQQMSRFLEELPREVLEGDIPTTTGRSRGRFPDYVPPPRREVGEVIEYEPEYDPSKQGLGRRGRTLPTALLGAGAEREATALARSFEAVKARLRSASPPPVAAATDEPRVELDDGGAPPPPQVELEVPAAEPGGLVVHGRVDHEVFGQGTIVGFRGQGRMRSALVRFDEDARPRVIICRHLTPVGDPDEVRVVLDEAGS